MAKGLASWCDMCLDVDKRVPATFHHVKVQISSPNRPWRMKAPGDLDLCNMHYTTVIVPLAEALDYAHDRGQRLRGRDRNPGRNIGPFQCQVPGCLAAPLKHRGTLWQHLRKIHEITLDEYLERYGELVPLTQEQLDALVVEARCEECGKTYSTATGTRWPRQALVSHMRGRHLQSTS